MTVFGFLRTFTVDVERVIEPYFMRTDTLKVKGDITRKMEGEERVLKKKKGPLA